MTMFELPGFDPKTMTDEQIQTRISDLSGKIAYASGGPDNGALGVMTRMLEALFNEGRERSGKARYKDMLDADPIAIETDPDLREQNRKAAEKRAGKDEIQGATRPRINPRRSIPVPTATPVAPQPDQPIRQPSEKKT